MKIKLQTRDGSKLPWQDVQTAEYTAGSELSLAKALEYLLKCRDGWIDSGHFPATAAWRIAPAGQI